MIPALATLKAASLTTRLIVYGVLLALIAGLLWWAVGAPRVALAKMDRDYVALGAEYAAVKLNLAEADAAAGEKTKAVQAAYDAGVASAKDMRDRETSDAYKRGVATGKRITAGTQRVRVEWRDRCPVTADGSGAGSGEGAAQVSGDRAEAIGRVIGIGGAADATYAEAMRRLESAQKLLNACYEQPAR